MHEQQRSLYQIIAPHFTAGIEIEDGHCIRCAPIIRYMMGKSYWWIRSYCRTKVWDMIEISNRNRNRISGDKIK